MGIAAKAWFPKKFVYKRYKTQNRMIIACNFHLLMNHARLHSLDFE